MGTIRRALRFQELDTGCMVCVSHRTNAQGYVNVRWRESGREVTAQLHRLVFASRHGPIPAGYDVDHICKTKCCSNPAHLRLLTRRIHGGVSGRSKGAAKRKAACSSYLSGVTHPPALARLHGVNRVTAYRWIKAWQLPEAQRAST